MKRLLTTLALAAAAGSALAQATPVGLWKTIDDETKAERSLVRITEAGGVLSGRIEKFLDPQTKADVVCVKCTDDRAGKPVLGMTIIRGAKADAGRQHWEGGDILDPKTGKVYRVRLHIQDGGKALEVRGYLGFFYRNQYWQRQE
jgi:hypothetical protein